MFFFATDYTVSVPGLDMDSRTFHRCGAVFEKQGDRLLEGSAGEISRDYDVIMAFRLADIQQTPPILE